MENKDWCIKLTEENNQSVISYLNNKYKKNCCGFIGEFYGELNDNFGYDKNPFWIPISFEQFKEMVANDLKSQIVETISNNLDSSKHIPFLQGLENDKQTVFDKTLNSLADLLKSKNRKYGNSALEPLQIFGNKCKVGTRIDDKLARVKNSNELKKNDIADLIGYLTLICVENNWSNFDEFKD